MILKVYARLFAFLTVLALFVLSGHFPQHPGKRFSVAHLTSLSEAEAKEPRGIYTYRYDSSRSGINPYEQRLKPSSVNQTTFGLLYTDTVDAPVYAQPLYIPDVNIGGVVHQVAYVATENDSVYAFDATTQGAPLLQTSLLGPGEQPIPHASCSFTVFPYVGITSTPVIDPATGTLYVLARSELQTATGTQYFARLHALKLSNLKAKLTGFPVVISGSVPGTGSGSVGGSVAFDPEYAGQRAALLLAENNPSGGKQIYVAFASLCDAGTFHGWIFGYNARTGQQLSVFNTTPNGYEGGIWASGNGLAEDANGEIYAAVSNGDYNPPVGDYGDTLLQLTPPSSGPGQLTVADTYTPSYQCAENVNDHDFGTGGVVLLPPQPTSPTNLLVTEDKYGTIFLLNCDNLGGGPTPVTCPGTVPPPTEPPECAAFPMLPECFFSVSPGPGYKFAAPVFFNGNLYVTPWDQPPEVYALSDGAFPTSPTTTVPANQFVASAHGEPGMSLSASGVNNALLWILDDEAYNETTSTDSGPPLLYAFDPTNMSGPVFVSNQLPGSANPGETVKFAVPAEINGKVYVGTQSTLAVYGMLTAPPAKPIRLIGAQSSTVDGATAVILTMPAGVVAGNLLIAQIAADDSAGAPIQVTEPQGWTLLNLEPSPAGDQTQVIYWKIAGTTEPASYTWTVSTPVSVAGGIAAYRNVNTASPFDVVSGDYFPTASTSITAPSLTTSYEHEQLIVLLAAFTGESSASWTFPPGMTSEMFAQDTDAEVSAPFLGQALGLADPTGNRTALVLTAAPAAVASLSIRAAGY